MGKSTLFNTLTGLRQHTGNWPGKTVSTASGTRLYKGITYTFTDLPGTYSLTPQSEEEEAAEEFLRSGCADCVVVVCDATRLERSLALALEIRRLTRKVMVCLNLMDEARREGLSISIPQLERALAMPVVGITARTGQGLEVLLETIRNLCDGFVSPSPTGPWEEENPVLAARACARAAVTEPEQEGRRKLRGPDRLFLHPLWGNLVLLVLLFGILWLTITGANYPSMGLQWCFDALTELLHRAAQTLPPWLSGALIDGIFATTGRVISVMLPPMAIFFPCFSLLEDWGYLPRGAFLLDEGFRRSGACGKQALTLCMGLGCNAVGVTGCRIISSPRERLLAILTNSLVPCNGRFPGLLFLAGLLAGGSALRAGILTACLLLSLFMTLILSSLLSKTLLRGKASSFVLELPPYRRPRTGFVLLRALRDRVLKVLGRAVLVSVPAGLLIWILGNTEAGGVPILVHMAQLLEPAARWLGFSGAVLLAFLLASPANELVLPVLLMILTAASSLGGDSALPLAQALEASGWSPEATVTTMLFFLFHWPCATTVLTIRKETGSLGWTALGVMLPTAVGTLLCFVTHVIFLLFP